VVSVWREDEDREREATQSTSVTTLEMVGMKGDCSEGLPAVRLRRDCSEGLPGGLQGSPPIPCKFRTERPGRSGHWRMTNC